MLVEGRTDSHRAGIKGIDHSDTLSPHYGVRPPVPTMALGNREGRASGARRHAWTLPAAAPVARQRISDKLRGVRRGPHLTTEDSRSAPMAIRAAWVVITVHTPGQAMPLGSHRPRGIVT